MRYGIIGVGMMGREHLYNLAALPGAMVVAVADPHPGSREAALAATAGLQSVVPSPPLTVFSDHGSLLDSAMCDVVVIATPNMTHAQILLDVLAHPKAHHVLVEKPLCTTVEDCHKVLEAAKARPEVLVQVGLEYRYIPAVAELLAQVRRSAVGQVRMVAIREHRFPFLVKVNNWNRFNKNTGGTLVEKCCHFFDLMTLIAKSKPVRVLASGSQTLNHLDERYEGKVPDILDNAYVIVEYENGSRGMLDLSMFAEGSRNEQEICVVGDTGKAEAFVPDSIVRLGSRISGRDGVQTYEVHDKRVRYEGLHHGSSYLEHMEFAGAVHSHGKQAPAVGLEDGLMSVAVGVAAHKSIETGRFISIEEVILGRISVA